MARRPPSIRSQAMNALGQGAYAFNLWRKGVNPGYLKLRDVQVEQVDLGGLRFERCHARGAVFRDTVLRDALFGGSNLNLAVFVDCDLSGADFRQAKLEGATFRRCVLDGANFYGTSRPQWRLEEITCHQCWITRDRHQHPDEPDLFESDEFEVAYGGQRVTVRLPGGFQSIDLLALPYHASELMRRFPEYDLVLTGLSTVGEPSLEFRIASDAPPDVHAELGQTAREIADIVRDEVRDAFSTLLGQHMEGQTALHKSILALSERVAGRPASEGGTYYLSAESLHMDTYFTEAGSAAVGPRSSLVNEVWTELVSNASSGQLEEELKALAESLGAEGDPNARAAAEHVKTALAAFQNGERSKFVRALESAGKWGFENGTKIGVSLATKALGVVLGLK